MEAQGFYQVFVLTFWLGGIAVVLCVFEWIRQARTAPSDQSMIFSQQKLD